MYLLHNELYFDPPLHLLNDCGPLLYLHDSLHNSLDDYVSSPYLRELPCELPQNIFFHTLLATMSLVVADVMC